MPYRADDEWTCLDTVVEWVDRVKIKCQLLSRSWRTQSPEYTMLLSHVTYFVAWFFKSLTKRHPTAAAHMDYINTKATTIHRAPLENTAYAEPRQYQGYRTFFDLPPDYADPEGRNIRVFARNLVPTNIAKTLEDEAKLPYCEHRSQYHTYGLLNIFILRQSFIR